LRLADTPTDQLPNQTCQQLTISNALTEMHFSNSNIVIVVMVSGNLTVWLMARNIDICAQINASQHDIFDRNPSARAPGSNLWVRQRHGGLVSNHPGDHEKPAYYAEEQEFDKNCRENLQLPASPRCHQSKKYGTFFASHS
jgi:hypothetical protein